MKKKIYLVGVIVLILAFFSIIFADSNGVWNLAQDLRGGIVGEDEQFGNTGYTFINPVYINDTIKVDGNDVATLNSSGVVPVSQLPFHKGDLVDPASRPLLSGLSTYDTHYFNVSQLGIDSIEADYVLEGVSFGPGNLIQGGLDLDQVCNTAGGNVDCTPNPNTYIGTGTYFWQIGDDGVLDTSYCNKFEIFSDGSVDVSTVFTAGTCEFVNSCDDSSQQIGYYPSGTSCGGYNDCDGSGNCFCNPIPKSVACSGRECGSASTGCGSYYNCGGCYWPEICMSGTCERDEDEDPNGAGMCFIAGTKVDMSDGSLKNIEDVEVGDIILSYDVDSNEFYDAEVRELWSHVRSYYYIFEFEDGSSLEMTSEHPIYVKGKGWSAFEPEETLRQENMLVEKLVVGDSIFKKGEWVKLVSAQRVDGDIMTYNLKDIESSDMFFVNGFLVHNKKKNDLLVDEFKVIDLND